MLKSPVVSRASPALTPRFRHVTASPRSSPRSSSVMRDPSKPATPFTPSAPRGVKYVDAWTQYSPSEKMDSVPSLPKSTVEEPPKLPGPPVAEEPKAVRLPPVSTPAVQPSPGMKRRQSGEAPVASLSAEQDQQRTGPKRVRPAEAQVKTLPAKYELCEVEDIVLLIADMIQELIHTNDELPLRSGVLTRFHSRTPPGIGVFDYLQRLAKHATLTPPLLLSMVYYIDRLCSLYPAFTITTLTVHRFLITAATVAAKGLSDSFWNNSTYARVGGVKVAELGLLELEFLYRVDWKIVPNPEVLVDYYRGLVKRSDAYQLEGDGDDLDEEEDESDENEEDENEGISDSVDASPEATESKWKAWMEDVSSQKASGQQATDKSP